MPTSRHQEARRVLAARPDLAAIFQLIPAGASVLDLGCGNGDLLFLLRAEKKVGGQGIELDQANILACVAAGVPVLHGNLDEGLRDFPDGAFEYVVLSRTLQAVARPDRLLAEMSRVGRRLLISYINLGHWRARWQLLTGGRMPVTPDLPYQWYDTPNIHLGTILDFRHLCRAQGLAIIRELPMAGSHFLLARRWPNLFAATCVFELERAD